MWGRALCPSASHPRLDADSRVDADCGSQGVTSFGTFLSTLCHEFCHHLDFKKFGFVDSWHTRGFYERAGVLYHYSWGTPLKRLFWVPVAGGRWRINWQSTNRSGKSNASV